MNIALGRDKRIEITRLELVNLDHFQVSVIGGMVMLRGVIMTVIVLAVGMVVMMRVFVRVIGTLVDRFGLFAPV